MTVDRLTYTINEAASAIGIGRSMLYKLIDDGDLRTVHIGKRVLITKDWMLELLGMQALVSAPEDVYSFQEPRERTYIVAIRPA